MWTGADHVIMGFPNGKNNANTQEVLSKSSVTSF